MLAWTTDTFAPISSYIAIIGLRLQPPSFSQWELSYVEFFTLYFEIHVYLSKIEWIKNCYK